MKADACTSTANRLFNWQRLRSDDDDFIDAGKKWLCEITLLQALRGDCQVALNAIVIKMTGVDSCTIFD